VSYAYDVKQFRKSVYKNPYAEIKKVKFTLKPAMKAQRGEKGVDVQLYSFFNLEATWGWVVIATPWPLYPRERDPVPNAQEVARAPGPV
jgi:hypothetical protein